MEADWEIEIGPNAPIIDAFWDGFIDLGSHPERVREIPEGQVLPALVQLLLALNGPVRLAENRSLPSLWTSKCDVWSFEEVDPYEMDAEQEEAQSGCACYVDLMPREGFVFAGFDDAEKWARQAVDRMKQSEQPNCRVDIVIRRAVAGQAEGYGMTAYIAGCGSNSVTARAALSIAMKQFASAVQG